MIKGNRVDLVAVSMIYIEEYHKWINDPDVCDMLGMIDFPLSLEKERQWVEESFVQRESEKIFTILTKRGKPIGNIALMEIDYINRCAEMGIMIGEREYWNREYGTNAINTLLEFAFNNMNLSKICLTTNESNKRALACYKKCGFSKEGRLRKQRYYRGKYENDLLMGISREDWIRKRSRKK